MKSSERNASAKNAGLVLNDKKSENFFLFQFSILTPNIFLYKQIYEFFYNTFSNVSKRNERDQIHVLNHMLTSVQPGSVCDISPSKHMIYAVFLSSFRVQVEFSSLKAFSCFTVDFSFVPGTYPKKVLDHKITVSIGEIR